MAASNWLQDERLGLVGFAVSVLVRFDGGLLALADRVAAAGGVGTALLLERVE